MKKIGVAGLQREQIKKTIETVAPDLTAADRRLYEPPGGGEYRVWFEYRFCGVGGDLIYPQNGAA